MRAFSTELHAKSKQSSWNNRYPKAHTPPIDKRREGKGRKCNVQICKPRD